MTLTEAVTKLRSTADELEVAAKAADEKEHEVDTSALESSIDSLTTDVEGIKEEIEEADDLDDDEEDEDEDEDEEDEEDEKE